MLSGFNCEGIQMRRIVCVAMVLGVLAGCGEKKLDGSSPEAFKKSAEKIAADLPKEQREKFQSDLMVVAFQNFDMANIFSGKKSADDVAGEAFKVLDGKTVNQVSQEADRVKAERAEREKQQALAEIAELSDKMEKSESAKKELSKFEVVKSRFYKKEEQYSFRDKPIIEISVKNGTDKAVSRAYFKGTIASPGRSVPWLVEDFNYQISGGLEPGETQSWSLAPNQFGEWGQVSAPKDAILTVEVVKLDGADGKALFGSTDFTDKDRERLAALKAKYQN